MCFIDVFNTPLGILFYLDWLTEINKQDLIMSKAVDLGWSNIFLNLLTTFLGQHDTLHHI